eukprot:NODE_14_length_51535_cov_1.125049.p37 type:complete len:168 gc:universal NODE_14_length_51535_cov_1.125049:14076-14579(+)
MGNDGGSIQKRREVVKVKAIERSKKDSDNLEDYLICAISSQNLHAPIMSCKLGKLYNKNALIQYMIDRKEGTKDIQDVAKHIKSLKQVKLLHLDDPSNFVCPLTNKKFGRGVFVYLNCGCVFSKQEFKICPTCNIPVTKITTINPLNLEIQLESAKIIKKAMRRSGK